MGRTGGQRGHGRINLGYQGIQFAHHRLEFGSKAAQIAHRQLEGVPLDAVSHRGAPSNQPIQLALKLDGGGPDRPASAYALAR